MLKYLALVSVLTAIVATSAAFAGEPGKPAGSFEGIGVQLNPKRTFDGYFAVERVPSMASKSARATLKKGDRIVAVDGVAVRGKSLQEVIDRISGPAGTSVRVKVRRANTAATIEMAIIRQSIAYFTR